MAKFTTVILWRKVQCRWAYCHLYSKKMNRSMLSKQSLRCVLPLAMQKPKLVNIAMFTNFDFWSPKPVRGCGGYFMLKNSEWIWRNAILVGVVEFQTPLILPHWRRLSTVSPAINFSCFINYIHAIPRICHSYCTHLEKFLLDGWGLTEISNIAWVSFDLKAILMLRLLWTIYTPSVECKMIHWVCNNTLGVD